MKLGKHDHQQEWQNKTKEIEGKTSVVRLRVEINEREAWYKIEGINKAKYGFLKRLTNLIMP